MEINLGIMKRRLEAKTSNLFVDIKYLYPKYIDGASPSNMELQRSEVVRNFL